MKEPSHSPLIALLEDIARQYAEFKRHNTISRRTRYPQNLKMLVMQASQQGASCRDLTRITGLPSTRIKIWLASKNSPVRRLTVVKPPLSTVPSTPPPQTPIPSAVIRFKSGTVLEINTLNCEIITAICQNEVQHAAAR